MNNLFAGHFYSYSEFNLSDWLSSRLAAFQRDVENLSFSHSGDELEKQIQNSYQSYQITPLVFKQDQINCEIKELMIPADMFPRSNFIVEDGESYLKPVCIFYLPFNGEEKLLHSIPSTRIMRNVDIYTSGHNVVFEVVQFYDDGSDVVAKKLDTVSFLVAQSENVNKEVEKYNISLQDAKNNGIANAMEKINKRSLLLEKLGVREKSSTLPELAKIVAKSNQIKTSKVKEVEKTFDKSYDVFISHAGEDRQYSSNLTKALEDNGIRVWHDGTELSWGDDLRSSIDKGLVNSRYGMVIFSKAFLAKKDWTEYELDGLVALEKNERKVILPIWHEITRSDLAKYSPKFADRIAKTSDSIDDIVSDFKKKLT